MTKDEIEIFEHIIDVADLNQLDDIFECGAINLCAHCLVREKCETMFDDRYAFFDDDDYIKENYPELLI